jgi:hypothetical protein
LALITFGGSYLTQQYRKPGALVIGTHEDGISFIESTKSHSTQDWQALGQNVFPGWFVWYLPSLSREGRFPPLWLIKQSFVKNVATLIVEEEYLLWVS